MSDHMKARCIAAIETYRKMPGVPRPATYKSCWPEYEASLLYPKGMDLKIRATAAEISDADAFTDLVNRHLDEIDRKEVWRWGMLKVLSNRTIKGHCDKYGLKEHHYRRRIDDIFRKLAKTAPVSPVSPEIRLVDREAKSDDNRASSDVYREDGGNIVAWRPDGAKPVETRSVQNVMSRFKVSRVGA